MKKITILLLAVSFATIYSCETKRETVNETVVPATGEVLDRDESLVQTSDLPQTANDFITQNFGSETVQSVVKEKNTLGGDDYKVILSDGTKIDFDADGNWQDVENESGKSIGLDYVPASIATYLTQNYPEIGVKSISRDKKEIEVNLLQTDVDLKFDLNGNFLRIDQ